MVKQTSEGWKIKSPTRKVLSGNMKAIDLTSKAVTGKLFNEKYTRNVIIFYDFNC